MSILCENVLIPVRYLYRVASSVSCTRIQPPHPFPTKTYRVHYTRMYVCVLQDARIAATTSLSDDVISARHAALSDAMQHASRHLDSYHQISVTAVRTACTTGPVALPCTRTCVITMYLYQYLGSMLRITSRVADVGRASAGDRRS